MYRAADRAVDAAGHHAVDIGAAIGGFMSADRDGRHGEGRLVDDAAADEQDLRQDEHDEEHRDDCAAPEALADAGDDRLGRHAADQKAADGEDGAGGQDRREGKVQRLDDGVAVVHLALQLLIARGDDDGIVDVRAHLDGADDQIWGYWRIL